MKQFQLKKLSTAIVNGHVQCPDDYGLKSDASSPKCGESKVVCHRCWTKALQNIEKCD